MQGSACNKIARRVRIQRRALAETEWFYATLGGRVPEDAPTVELAAARRIEGWLKQLAAFHRGAFSLRYTPREWPKCLVEEFGEETSLVVRLECARHPAVGVSDEALEAASVLRLTKALAACAQERERRAKRGRDFDTARSERPLVNLAARAGQHMTSAIRALVKVRGDAPCAVPNRVERIERAVDACE